MGLRVRTIFIFMITISLSVVVSVLVSRSYYIYGFDRIEEQAAEETARRAMKMIEHDLEHLNVLVRDWADWDDSFNFIKNKDPDFITANLTRVTFEGLNLSSLIYLDDTSGPLFSYTADSPDPEDLMSAFPSLPNGPPEDHLSGLIESKGELHIAVARPVRRTDGSSEPAGSLIMTQPFDSDRTSSYSELLGVEIFSAINTGLAEGPWRIRKEAEHLQVEHTLTDIGGNPLAMLVVRKPRTIHTYGSESLLRYSLAVAFALGIVALASMLILEALVFRSMRSIGSQLDRIASGADPDARISVPGNDELGALGAVMNRTLDTLNARVRERDVMLSEIHHRVKNNLQIIASISSLQQGQSSDEKVRRALSEGNRRIQAMAFVHNELYFGTDVSRFSLALLLSHFVRYFQHKLGEPSPVKAEVHSADIYIPSDFTVPLCICLSEILSNSYLHAFPAGAAGAIRVDARMERTGKVCIEIRDNGSGIPPEAERREGLGITLIRTLSGQMGGSSRIEALPEGGTLSILRLPVAPDAPASEPGLS